jgi:hypothetical protein
MSNCIACGKPFQVDQPVIEVRRVIGSGRSRLLTEPGFYDERAWAHLNCAQPSVWNES